ncbi:hypothetical protein [Cytobacillus oceanisediminis]|uniref:Uncharacterized protein n=1 Tax=Cytobacillus oceanisediminis TaxID=665099 RepID=A0ABX3CYY6_9BACI|nr:hypothetical protein [Cytobacillus oceanisediminis]OHX50688.1 hypothetical protein BBV17_06610 [Cytobacillus oceanisediminis]
MKNALIYYQQKQKEKTSESINIVNKIIKVLQKEDYKIMGVYIDKYNNQIEFMELIQEIPSHLNQLFIEYLPEDEFNQQILNELAKTENFEIRYFSEIDF